MATETPEKLLVQYRKKKTHLSPVPPLDSMILSILSDVTDDPKQAREALDAMRETFVDWNECRVARRAELARLLDPLPQSDDASLRIIEFLNRLFDLRGAMDLLFVEDMKPTEARRTLLDLDSEMSRDVVSMVLFRLCPGTTLPLSPEALKVARAKGLIGRSGTKQQLQKALLAELSILDAGELALYLELEAHGSPAAQKTRRKASAKSKNTKKKTKKKQRKS